MVVTGRYLLGVQKLSSKQEGQTPQLNVQLAHMCLAPLARQTAPQALPSGRAPSQYGRALMVEGECKQH